MKDADERELVRLCLRHDRLAWERFVDRYSNYIHSVIVQGLRAGRFSHKREDAENILAAVFLSLVEKDFHLLRSFQWRCSLTTWLWIIARKKVLRHFRKKGVRTVPLAGTDREGEEPRRPAFLVSDEPDPSEIAGQEERRSILEDTLTQLGDRDRLCLSLYFYEGLSYKEIAKTMDMAANHVGILIFRAKKRMQKHLKEKGLGEL